MGHQAGRNGNGTSLMTTLGIMEGELITYLEARGPSTLRCLIQEVEGPARLIMMAAGSLVRKGLVAGYQRDLEVLLCLEGAGDVEAHAVNGGSHAQR